MKHRSRLCIAATHSSSPSTHEASQPTTLSRQRRLHGVQVRAKGRHPLEPGHLCDEEISGIHTYKTAFSARKRPPTSASVFWTPNLNRPNRSLWTNAFQEIAHLDGAIRVRL